MYQSFHVDASLTRWLAAAAASAAGMKIWYTASYLHARDIYVNNDD